MSDIGVAELPLAWYQAGDKAAAISKAQGHVKPISHRFCIAPMMDWTDRHCRFFHRLLTQRALIYTEMITTGAVLHGDRVRLMGYDPAEHPVALQLGGSAVHAAAGKVLEQARERAAELLEAAVDDIELTDAGEFGVRTCTKGWIEPILTMRPRLVRSGSRKAWVTLNTPLTLIAMMSCQSFSTAAVSAVNALRGLMPALLTRIETCPTLPAMSFATAMQSSRLVTSSLKLSALPPLSRISLAASAAVFSSMSSSTARAPSLA